MKKSTKWIVGILICFFVIIIVSVASWMLFNQLQHSEWVYGSRSGRLWDSTPYNQTPRFRIPAQKFPGVMPIHPFGAREGSWTGFFGPFRLIGGALICLGIPVLLFFGLVIGLVILLVRPQKPKAITTTQPGVSETELRPRPSCSQQIQPEWKHCPFCGTIL